MERTVTPVVLEPAAREFADVTSRPPFVHEMTPDEARRVLDDLQAGPVEKPPVAEEWVTVAAGVGDSAGGNMAAALTAEGQGSRRRVLRAPVAVLNACAGEACGAPPRRRYRGDRARRGPTGGWRVGLAWPRGPVGPLR